MPIDAVALAQRAAGCGLLATDDCVSCTLVSTHTLETNIGSDG
jgi:hypothetical protein